MKIIRIFARKSNCNKHENKFLRFRKDLANREKQFEQTEGCRSFPVHSGKPLSDNNTGQSQQINKTIIFTI